MALPLPSSNILETTLLGQFSIRLRGQAVEIASRPAQTLLAYLLLNPGIAHRREQLSGLLWPDSLESSARKNLRNAIWQLRRAIGERYVQAEKETVAFDDTAPYQSDVALLADPAPGVQGLTTAVAAYRGELLPGFYEDWVALERERLKALFEQRVQALLEALKVEGRWAEVQTWAEHWIALGHVPEPAYRALMEAYAARGDRAGVANAYRRCVQTLKDELDVAPSEETQALFRRLSGEGEAATPRQPAVAEVTPAALSPAERYVEEQLLFVGGQGEVYRGVDRATGQPVVIKRLPRGPAGQSPEHVERLVREGELLRQLDHPNIVKVLATFEREGQPAIVLEYVPGGNLREMLDREGRLPVPRILALALELADALSRTHHLGILHRDIKPDNVLLAADGQPRLTDFGLARFAQQDARLTQPGLVMGSPLYMSPEALQSQEIDARTDIWAFGVLLYEMLAGQPPFGGKDTVQAVAAVLNSEPVPLVRWRPDTPPALTRLVDRMLVKDRSQRLGSMRQVAAELEAIRDGRVTDPASVPARPDTGGTAIWPAAAGAANAASGLQQQIYYCTAADGVRIAYAMVGDGPPLLKAANWLSHLEYDWVSPIWRHWLLGLGAGYQLIRYDERACGLSDWNVDDISFEAWVRDLEAVADVSGHERFALLGISKGAAISIAYAARHPERVSHLILYGGYARGRLSRNPPPDRLQEIRLMHDLMRVGWGKDNAVFRQVFSTMFLPEGTLEQLRAFNELQRQSATPENAGRIYEASSTIDVTEAARELRVPTLILHGRQDQVIPHAEGRLLAKLIPGARLVTLESTNHILLEHEPAWQRFLAEVHEFLRTGPGGGPARGAAPAMAARSTPQSWPSARTPFFGRREELAEIARLLADPACRLLTLLGPGGTGKTRLALEVAHRLLADNANPFPDGVFFVPLAPLKLRDQLIPAIANAVGISFYGERPPQEQLVDYLRARRLLLVLDNCEHLLDDEAACLLVDLLNGAPGLALLATSRTKLNVVGEQMLLVSGLTAPGPEGGETSLAAAALARYSALQLFQQAARRARPDFSVTPDNLADVIRICRLVDGMPLAIELAAAWLEMLAPGEIAAEIERSLDFLESDLRDLPERHRSLRAVFVSSWGLLTDVEREALKGLSVFRGNFTRQAAEKVADASLRTLLALVNKSWLQPVSGRDSRYQIHPLLRQYASARLLTETEAWSERRQRHAEYYAGRVQALDAALHGAQPQDAIDALRADFEEVLAAWEWLVQTQQFGPLVEQMLPALFSHVEGQLESFVLLPLLESAKRAIKAAGSPPACRRQLISLLTAEGALLQFGASFRNLLRDVVYGARRDEVEEAWSLVDGPESLLELGFWGALLPAVYAWMVDLDAGLERLQALVPLLRRAEQPWVLAFALQQLGWVEYQRIDKMEQAGECLNEALTLFGQLGDEREGAHTLRYLGILRLVQRALPEAADHLRAAQAKHAAIGEWANAAGLHWMLCDVALRQGQLEQAFDHLRQLSRAFLERGYINWATTGLSREAEEALRYSTIEHALRARQEALALAQANQATQEVAWSTWHIGEIYRVAGDLPRAREWYDRAAPLFDRLHDRIGPVFYHRGLGDIAHALGDYAEASRQFQISLDLSATFVHSWAVSYALAGLGRAALALGAPAEARQHLHGALDNALRTGDPGILLLALGRLAELFAKTGQAERAVALGTLVAQEFMIWQETRDEVGAALGPARAALTPAQLGAAEARGSSGDPWAVARQLQAELAAVT